MDQYSKQEWAMVHETPTLYERIVKPYISSIPPSRTQWVQEIISGRSEANKVLYRSPSDNFLILPDMKWDLTTVNSLYLVAIVISSEVRSLRDLNGRHVEMLRCIRAEAVRVVSERWGLREGEVRLFVHYQPSYCESPRSR